jgi:hypothetical protein
MSVSDYDRRRAHLAFLEFHDFLAQPSARTGQRRNACSMSEPEATPGVVFYGEATVSAKGVMNLAVEARRDIGLEGGGRLLAFGRDGHIILTPVPLADDLATLALASAAKRKGGGRLRAASTEDIAPPAAA